MSVIPKTHDAHYLTLETRRPRQTEATVTRAKGHLQVVQRRAIDMATLASGWDGTAPKRVKVTDKGILQTTAQQMSVMSEYNVGNIGTTRTGAVDVYGASFSLASGGVSFSSVHLYDDAGSASMASQATCSVGVEGGQTVTVSFPGPVRFNAGISLRFIEGADPLGNTFVAQPNICTLFYRPVA